MMVLLTGDTSEMTSQIAETVSEQAEENVEQVNEFIKYVYDAIPNIISFGIKVMFSLLIFAVGMKLIKWCRKILRKSMEKANAEIGVIQFVDSAVKYGLYALLIVIIANRFGIETTSFAALLASAGVAIGMGLQGSLANIAGGVLIMILKPFAVGDYIISGNYEGTISEIQIYYSKMQTVDNQVVIIPNGELSDHSLINVTKENERRLDMDISISYDADLRKAKSILQGIVDADPDVIHEKDKLIVVSELGQSAVVIGVKIWVATDKYWDAKWRMLETIKLQLDENGIEIPYNKLDVYVKQDGSEKEVQ